MTSKNFDHPFKRSQIDRPEPADTAMIANELDELKEGSIIFNVVTWFTYPGILRDTWVSSRIPDPGPNTFTFSRSCKVVRHTARKA